jgi:hypothetical protein
VGRLTVRQLWRRLAAGVMLTDADLLRLVKWVKHRLKRRTR